MAARKKATRKPAKRARAKAAAKSRARGERARAEPAGAGKSAARRPVREPRAPRAPRKPAAAAPPPPQRAEPEARPPHAALRVVSSAPALIARVLHYYGRAGAASLALEGALALGDWIHVRGATSDFVQRVASLRAGGRAAQRAESGEVSVQLAERARPGDRVFVLRPAP
jgi:hypothetical protein